jgi:CBS domain containing-hemolysin-like protein
MADLLSAISVFLVFLTFLLNSIEKEVLEALSTRKPETSQTVRLNKYKTDLKRLLYLKSLPVSLIYLVSFYVLLPDTIKIISSSTLNFWDFDELNTLFVFIELGLLGLTIYSIIRTFQLFKKIKK